MLNARKKIRLLVSLWKHLRAPMCWIPVVPSDRSHVLLSTTVSPAFSGHYGFFKPGQFHSCILVSWSWMYLVLRPLLKMINSLILPLYKTKWNFIMHVPRVTLNDDVTSISHMRGVDKYLPTHHACIVLYWAFCCVVLLMLPGIWESVSQ